MNSDNRFRKRGKTVDCSFKIIIVMYCNLLLLRLEKWLAADN